MKIAYVIEDFSIKGGAERILSRKANLLDSTYGHEVTIISIYHDERPQSYPLNKNVTPKQIHRNGIQFQRD